MTNDKPVSGFVSSSLEEQVAEAIRAPRLIEALARALCVADENDPDETLVNGDGDEIEDSEQWRQYTPEAGVMVSVLSPLAASAALDAVGPVIDAAGYERGLREAKTALREAPYEDVPDGMNRVMHRWVELGDALAVLDKLVPQEASDGEV